MHVCGEGDYGVCNNGVRGMRGLGKWEIIYKVDDACSGVFTWMHGRELARQRGGSSRLRCGLDFDHLPSVHMSLPLVLESEASRAWSPPLEFGDIQRGGTPTSKIRIIAGLDLISRSVAAKMPTTTTTREKQSSPDILPYQAAQSWVPRLFP